jgi:EAL domain-containing protein (putative c-di-GMP-specific phosphodiesterase class I)
LALALDADQFFLVYQPTIDLHTGAFAGVEALIRWRHPVHGVINPTTFIAELEKSGQIVPVGSWALITACVQGALWHAKGYRFSVSVNISIKQLEAETFVDDVDDALTLSGFDPALLVLEFTQNALTKTADTSVRCLEALKNLGVRLAVDDFSPGDSPQADLQRFHIDIVKFEKNFISGVPPSDPSQIHSLVQLAQSLNVQIFASGIEHADQVKQLKIEQVAVGQGFFFSTPHEAPDIDRFLEDFSIFSGKPL